MPRFFFFACCTLIAFSTFATKPRLISGPMQGQTSATGTMIWVMVKNTAKVNISLKNPKTGVVKQAETKTAGIKDYKRNVPVTIEINGLEPSTEYEITVKLDEKVVSEGRKVKTFTDKKDGDISFLFGSCAYLPPNGFRWIQPGINERTYNYMIKKPADFMMWTGDYLYFWPWHYKSYNGMMRKYVHTRQHPKMERFVESKPQFAIWDDHDYGPNDSEKDWKFKDQALELYKYFWPQQSYGTDSAKGIYYAFTHGDAEFFMTDGRYYRDEPSVPHAEMLGKSQIKWLEAKLLASKAVFKFIVVGSQTLNKSNTHECYQHYTEEVGELLNFIKEKNIDGVIFLTGDMHYSELTKMDRPGTYPLYDFTSSPITSFRFRVSKTSTPMANNPDRVPGTLYDLQNFGRVSISGQSPMCFGNL